MEEILKQLQTQMTGLETAVAEIDRKLEIFLAAIEEAGEQDDETPATDLDGQPTHAVGRDKRKLL